MRYTMKIMKELDMDSIDGDGGFYVVIILVALIVLLVVVEPIL